MAPLGSNSMHFHFWCESLKRKLAIQLILLDLIPILN